MSSIVFTLIAFLFSTILFLRAYHSTDQRYIKLSNSSVLKPSSLFMTQEHTVIFGLPPVFGAATIFLIYLESGGQLNFISLFLMMLTVAIGPFVLVKQFNKHKTAASNTPTQSTRVTTVHAPYPIFTRNTSPEKLALHKRFAIIQCFLIITILAIVLGFQFFK